MTSLTDAVLREGTDDWVPFRTVHVLAYTTTAEPDELSRRQSAIDAVRELLSEKLIEIGAVTDHGFAAWSTPLPGLNDFAREYLAADAAAEDDWGFRFWLSNTPAGDERAHRID
jgi:hypothetical protein